MKRGIIGLILVVSAFFLVPSVLASDVSVWQGQYFTGTTFNTGTYDFNFTVYDALVGGGACYSNTTTLTTGNWGEWKTEQNGVGTSCNNTSQSYFLNININGADQTPRRRLVVFDFLRKDVEETINITTTQTGFFGWLGSLTSRIAKLWVVDINATGNIETSQNVSAGYFKGDGSLLTGIVSPMGEVSLTNNSVVTLIEGANTWTLINASWDGNSDNMMFQNYTNGTLKYTGTETMFFHIAMTISVKGSGDADTMRASIYKNGVILPGGQIQQRRTGTATDVVSTAIHVATSLSTGDELNVYLLNENDADDYTVTYANLFAMGMRME